MEISSAELKTKIQNGEKVLVDFYGTFCGPCKVMKPFFEKAAESVKDENVNLYFFNIDQDRDFVVNEMNVRSVPTIKGFANGEQVYNSIGVLRTEQIVEVAKNL
jgi:thioredoxin